MSVNEIVEFKNESPRQPLPSKEKIRARWIFRVGAFALTASLGLIWLSGAETPSADKTPTEITASHAANGLNEDGADLLVTGLIIMAAGKLLEHADIIGDQSRRED